MICWEFTPSEYRTPLYQMELGLFVTAKGEWVSPAIPFIVDTGFDGDILLEEAIFESLGFSRFEEDSKDWDLGETIDGDHLILRASHTVVQLEKIEFKVRIETFPDNQENLVGRGLLNQMISQINGFNKEFCCSTTQQ